MAKIVTGYTGTAHVQSVDWQALNRAIFGTGSYVISKNVSNPSRTGNVITLPKMEIMLQGVHCRTDGTETITINYTTSGLKRYDKIVGRYSKVSSTGKESFSIEVVSGTAAENPTKPTISTGNVADGATTAEIALYDVLVTGTTSIEITKVYTVASDIDSRLTLLGTELSNRYNSVSSSITSLENSLNTTNQNLETAKSELGTRINTATSNLSDSLTSSLTSTMNGNINQAKTALQNDYNSKFDSVNQTLKSKLNEMLETLTLSGRVEITPSGAGTVTTQTVAFTSSNIPRNDRTFAAKPRVVIVPEDGSPTQITAFSVTNVTSSGFNIKFSRTNTTKTTFAWVAVGRTADGLIS